MSTLLGPDTTVTRDFRVGDVMSKALEIYSSKFGLVIIIVGLALAPLIPVYLNLARDPDTVFSALLIELAYSHLIGIISQAMVIYAAFQQMRGRAASIGESVSKAFAVFIPIVVTSALVTVLWALGTMLLLIPGIIVATTCSVALPVCVVERLGPVRSLSRSAQLTKGFRGSIFGLFFSLGIVNLIVGAIIGAVVRGSPMLAGLVNYGWTVIVSGYSAVLAAIMYHDLRVAQEGIDIDQIAAVFD